jgi:hypothetical protein
MIFSRSSFNLHLWARPAWIRGHVLRLVLFFLFVYIACVYESSLAWLHRVRRDVLSIRTQLNSRSSHASDDDWRCQSTLNQAQFYGSISNLPWWHSTHGPCSSHWRCYSCRTENTFSRWSSLFARPKSTSEEKTTRKVPYAIVTCRLVVMYELGQVRQLFSMDR